MNRSVLFGIFLFVADLVFFVLHTMSNNKSGMISATIGVVFGAGISIFCWKDKK